MKFKTGDVVRCVDGLDCFLKVGENYRVSGYSGGYLNFVRVENMRGNSVGGWCEARFELVERAEQEKDMANADFEIGEVLVCVNATASGTRLEVGGFYKVESYSDSDNGYIRVSEKAGGKTVSGSWMVNRFRRLEEVMDKTAQPQMVDHSADRDVVERAPLDYYVQEKTPYNHFPDLAGWEMECGGEFQDMGYSCSETL